MAKNIKLNIKNDQLAKALKFKKPVAKAAPAKRPDRKKVEPKAAKPAETTPVEPEAPPKRKVRARTRSAFAAPEEGVAETIETNESTSTERAAEAQSVAGPEEMAGPAEPVKESPPPPVVDKPANVAAPVLPRRAPKAELRKTPKPPPKEAAAPAKPAARPAAGGTTVDHSKAKKRKDTRDIKPKYTPMRPFDARDRQGLRAGEEDRWRRRRQPRQRRASTEETTVRPSELSIRIPVSIKELASQMKLKASALVGKLFMQGVAMTLNDILDDETTIQLLGQEFGCAITIDTTEEERLRITGKTVGEEIAEAAAEDLTPRAPVVTFMGHVDHGKTSLIDQIRKTNVASGEAGAITQHIGAFRCDTKVGPITILDTPGHEAFTAMRARGADVTDVVVLVVAGDEGIKTQTREAIQHAHAANVSIIVAINKCDKPNFNAETVYRELSEIELLPEAWGGTTITINCSAKTGEGVDELLEMIAIQSEVMELKANPSGRARGSVLESEMHKGLGSVATVLVQNGTLRHGDPVVFDDLYGRIKTMQDELGNNLAEAGPATPVAITGLSGVPRAGSEFIVVDDDKQAREIAQARHEGQRESHLAKRKLATMESMLQEAATAEQKVLNLILRADVQGSLEALKTALLKIESDKARIEVILSAVGSVSESDIELAVASNAIVIAFHTQVESHAESLIKQHKVVVKQHDIIYHAIDDVHALLTGRLDKVAEEHDIGEAEVRATFKSSHLGTIAGCYITDGILNRNARIRQKRDGEIIWTGGVKSIKRGTDDVKEIKSGFECGIVLDGQRDVEEGDTLEAYEVIYVDQQL